MTMPTHLPATREDAPPHPLQGRRVALYDEKSKAVLLTAIPRKVSSGGLILSSVAQVHLSHAAGHLVKLPMGDGVWLVSSDGFDHLNTIAGASVVCPPEIRVPGLGLCPNPYIERDAEGAFRSGFCRVMVFGRTPFGTAQIIDRPTSLSLSAYLQEDLAGKAEDHPTAICWGPKDMDPTSAVRLAIEERKEKLAEEIHRAQNGKKKWNPWRQENALKALQGDGILDAVERRVRAQSWVFLPVHGDLIGLHVDTSAQVVQRVLRTYSQGRKFGDRKLFSIAKRNALRAFFGFYKLPPERVTVRVDNPNAKPWDQKLIDATAPVVIWHHEENHDARQIQAILLAYQKGVGTEALAGMIGARVEVDARTEKAGAEDLHATLAEEPDAIPSGAAETQERLVIDDDHPQRDALVGIANGEGICGPRLVAKVRAQLNIEEDADLTKAGPDVLDRYRRALSAAADEEMTQGEEDRPS